jgi:hypothetical protein
MTLLKRTPTKIKANVASGSSASIGTVGFKTRLIFTYNEEPGSAYNLTGTSWTTNQYYDGVSDLYTLYPQSCTGRPVFPGNFWIPGKNVRVKGSFVGGNGSGPKPSALNCSLGMQFFSGQTPILGVQYDRAVGLSGGASHRFANGQNVSNTLVNFEMVIGYDYVQTLINKPTFFGRGFYEYSYSFNTTQDSNTEIGYVPVYSSNYAQGAGIFPSNLEEESTTIFNFYSSTSSVIRMKSLTIEELM